MAGRTTLARALIVACCLLAGAIVVRSESRGEAVVARRPLSLLPLQIDGWHGQPGPRLDEATVTALGVDDFVNRIYSSAGSTPVALYIGYYGTQRQGDTIHSPLNCLPGAGWQPISRARLSIPVRETLSGATLTRTIVVNRLVIEKDLDREMVLYWYQSHGRVVASEYWGRALLAIDAIRLNRTDSALVRVIVPIAADTRGDMSSARSAIRFVQALFPLLGSYLPK